MLGAEEILKRAGQSREQRGELGAAVIYQGSRRRGEHRLRNERGTRNAEVLRTVHWRPPGVDDASRSSRPQGESQT